MEAFFIMAIMLCLYSVMAVSIFADAAPHAFGNLSRAVISLFRIAAGETWVEDVPVLGRSGHVDWALGSFLMSFIVINNWILLQVRKRHGRGEEGISHCLADWAQEAPG